MIGPLEQWGLSMRRIILAAILAAYGCAAHGTDANGDWSSRCKSVSGLAESVMKSRQAGISMSSLMDMASDPAIKDTVSAMIMDAYEQPRFSTDQMKQETIADFRDAWYLKCAKAFGK